MRLSASLKGSLLLEVLVVCLLIALFLPFLVSALANVQNRHLLAQQYQNQFALQSAIETHFQAQWTRLLPAGCSLDERASITIQSGSIPPDRLASRRVFSESDWLYGESYGLCQGSFTVTENPQQEIALACHWKEGETARFITCRDHYLGQIIDINSRGNVSDIMFESDDVIGQSGILASQDGFYWYLSPGKDGSRAFWRTPAIKGNSRELFKNIERLAIFPLLDLDGDGAVDALATEYGEFSLEQVRALWVEYQYRLSDCRESLSDQAAQEYVSMRGDQWIYRSPCQHVGNQIINLQP
ncbi:hypothetical protein [Marinomonas algarum]|uniref:Uncharacterized protein n=1 Tax=Marinomonas algarum TaxID=2883105 RepID=A0A9X1IM50_9GAMM|nr:hypothetical protein [Marinomonas algarum]MCB5161344.1 hypothetical protein [Marinomonas algarum]